MTARRGKESNTATTVRITFESSEVFIVRQCVNNSARWCPVCREVVQVLRVEIATLVMGADTARVSEMIEAAGLHFESEEGTIFLCLNSLNGLNGKH